MGLWRLLTAPAASAEEAVLIFPRRSRSVHA